jgi:mRNA-degrading endonuclease RelE of RelBE toxin-antitoxin system
MIEPYEVFLRSEAIHSLRSIPVSTRKRISTFIDTLSGNPAVLGDYQMTDHTGRIIEIKILGSYAITFWIDHAAREIKVIDISHADRA